MLTAPTFCLLFTFHTPQAVHPVLWWSSLMGALFLNSDSRSRINHLAKSGSGSRPLLNPDPVRIRNQTKVFFMTEKNLVQSKTVIHVFLTLYKNI
jgi:hypothetical protein